MLKRTNEIRWYRVKEGLHLQQKWEDSQKNIVWRNIKIVVDPTIPQKKKPWLLRMFKK